MPVWTPGRWIALTISLSFSLSRYSWPVRLKMPVHSKEKKENNQEEMEVDYGEQDGSSSEEEDTDSSSGSEEGESSGEGCITALLINTLVCVCVRKCGCVCVQRWMTRTVRGGDWSVWMKWPTWRNSLQIWRISVYHLYTFIYNKLTVIPFMVCVCVGVAGCIRND